MVFLLAANKIIENDELAHLLLLGYFCKVKEAEDESDYIFYLTSFQFKNLEQGLVKVSSVTAEITVRPMLLS